VGGGGGSAWQCGPELSRDAGDAVRHTRTSRAVPGSESGRGEGGSEERCGAVCTVVTFLPGSL
jgi:hypothetical protein